MIAAWAAAGVPRVGYQRCGARAKQLLGMVQETRLLEGDPEAAPEFPRYSAAGVGRLSGRGGSGHRFDRDARRPRSRRPRRLPPVPPNRRRRLDSNDQWGTTTGHLSQPQCEVAIEIAGIAAGGWSKDINPKRAREGRAIINLAIENEAFQQSEIA